MNGLPTSTTNSNLDNFVDIIWGTTQLYSGAKVEVEVWFTNGDVTDVRLNIAFNKINELPSISGKGQISKCCLNQETYTVSNYGNADIFIWTIPNGWTVVGNSNQASIVVLPNANGAGQMTCRLEMSCASPSYHVNVAKNVNRVDAIVSLVPNNGVSNVNKFTGICALRQYTYTVPAVCGATSYTWNFPRSWSRMSNMTQHNFWISGQNTNSVTIFTADQPQTGNISATANFSSCNSVSTTLQANVLPAVPTTLNFVNESYEIYHCGAWKICPSVGNSVPISHPSVDFIESYTWTVTAPWYFRNSSNQIVYTLTTPINNGLYAQSPIVRRLSGYPGVSGTLSAFGSNCKGNSTVTSITIVEEEPGWCPGTPYWQPYPDGCECCEPNGGLPFPKKKEDSDVDISIFPNPAKDVLLIEGDFNSTSYFQITCVAGQVVKKEPLNNNFSEVDISDIPAGTFFVHIYTNQKTVVRKIQIVK